MPYCRYCGREIAYKHTKNDHWMPCNLLTGEKHFCKEGDNAVQSGLSVCPDCGKPVFENNGKIIDYSTLSEHECKKGDITRYTKYKDTAAKKQALAKKAEPKSSGVMINTGKTETAKSAATKTKTKTKSKPKTQQKKGASTTRRKTAAAKKTAQKPKPKKTAKGGKKK